MFGFRELVIFSKISNNHLALSDNKKSAHGKSEA
jgi:hypothetical protein